MPIVIKAAYGGGGKGMMVFNNNKEIDKYFSQLKSEAKNYFGDEIFKLFSNCFRLHKICQEQ